MHEANTSSAVDPSFNYLFSEPSTGLQPFYLRCSLCTPPPPHRRQLTARSGGVSPAAYGKDFFSQEESALWQAHPLLEQGKIADDGVFFAVGQQGTVCHPELKLKITAWLFV